MAYCPKCRYEYLEGIEKCPDCDAELVAELPEDAWSNEELAPIFAANNRAEADVIVGVLDSSGIRSWFRAEGTWRPATEIASCADWGNIFVLASRADEAKVAIEQALEAGKNEISESD